MWEASADLFAIIVGKLSVMRPGRATKKCTNYPSSIQLSACSMCKWGLAAILLFAKKRKGGFEKVQKGHGQSHERSRSKGGGQRSGSVINVKDKAGGLTPTSSCFIFQFLSTFCHTLADTKLTAFICQNLPKQWHNHLIKSVIMSMISLFEDFDNWFVDWALQYTANN